MNRSQLNSQTIEITMYIFNLHQKTKRIYETFYSVSTSQWNRLTIDLIECFVLSENIKHFLNQHPTFKRPELNDFMQCWSELYLQEKLIISNKKITSNISEIYNIYCHEHSKVVVLLRKIKQDQSFH